MDKSVWQNLLSFSPQDVVKIIVTALLIVLVTKVQVVSDRLSSLLIALPFTSLIAMVWMQMEHQSAQRIANHAEGTFWFVLPTMPMFLVIPWMLRHGWPFWPTMLANCVMTIVLFWIMVLIMRKFGMNLMP